MLAADIQAPRVWHPLHDLAEDIVQFALAKGSRDAAPPTKNGSFEAVSRGEWLFSRL